MFKAIDAIKTGLSIIRIKPENITLEFVADNYATQVEEPNNAKFIKAYSKKEDPSNLVVYKPILPLEDNDEE